MTRKNYDEFKTTKSFKPFHMFYSTFPQDAANLKVDYSI